jgi:hypothetical protein
MLLRWMTWLWKSPCLLKENSELKVSKSDLSLNEEHCDDSVNDFVWNLHINNKVLLYNYVPKQKHFRSSNDIIVTVTVTVKVKVTVSVLFLFHTQSLLGENKK